MTADEIINAGDGEIGAAAEKALKSQVGSSNHQDFLVLALASFTISLIRIADALETIAERKD